MNMFSTHVQLQFIVERDIYHYNPRSFFYCKRRMDELHPLMLHDIINFLAISSTMLQLQLAKGLTNSSLTCGRSTSRG